MPSSTFLQTPASSWRLDTADIIEHNMHRDGHCPWRSVICRATYSDNKKWRKFLTDLEAETQQCFEFCNGLDVLESKARTIIDDRSRFDSADTHAVRQRFQQWTSDHFPAEQRQLDSESHTRPVQPDLSPQYGYAIQIDEEALDSIINEPSELKGAVPREQR
ncbi:hypothetical protein QQS21_011530, partial [Conoideocrella luteorostrata]